MGEEMTEQFSRERASFEKQMRTLLEQNDQTAEALDRERILRQRRENEAQTEADLRAKFEEEKAAADRLFQEFEERRQNELDEMLERFALEKASFDAQISSLLKQRDKAMDELEEERRIHKEDGTQREHEVQVKADLRARFEEEKAAALDQLSRKHDERRKKELDELVGTQREHEVQVKADLRARFEEEKAAALDQLSRKHD